MPLLGLAIGYATSLVIANFMHFVGPLILIGVGLWELMEEGQEYFKKKKMLELHPFQYMAPTDRTVSMEAPTSSCIEYQPGRASNRFFIRNSSCYSWKCCICQTVLDMYFDWHSGILDDVDRCYSW